MMVVLTLILILSALAVLFVPKATERQKTQTAADRLQQWLLVSRQWAKRDRVSTGLRLQPSRANVGFVPDLQYMQQPPDYFVQPWNNTNFATPPTTLIPPPFVRRLQVVLGVGGPTSFNKVVLESIPAPNPAPGVVPSDFSSGYGMIRTRPGPPPVFTPTLLPNGTSSFHSWPIQPGDYLQIGDGPVHQIATVFTNTNGNYIIPPPAVPPVYDCDTFHLTGNGYPAAVPLTSQYRIIRAPRILQGEQPLQLPKDVAIDLNLSVLGAPFNPYTATPPPLDILFSSAGAVLGQVSATNKIILWARDVTQDGLQGDQTLITIFPRTGFIGANQVDMTNQSICTTSLTVPPRGPSLFYNPSPPPPSTLPPITVSSTYGMAAGTYVVLDPTGPNPELSQIALPPAGGLVQLSRVNYSHTAPFTIIVDPFSFTRDPRASGL
jgi:hypothetical protein